MLNVADYLALAEAILADVDQAREVLAGCDDLELAYQVLVADRAVQQDVSGPDAAPYPQ